MISKTIAAILIGGTVAIGTPATISLIADKPAVDQLDPEPEKQKEEQSIQEQIYEQFVPRSDRYLQEIGRDLKSAKDRLRQIKCRQNSQSCK